MMDITSLQASKPIKVDKEKQIVYPYLRKSKNIFLKHFFHERYRKLIPYKCYFFT